MGFYLEGRFGIQGCKRGRGDRCEWVVYSIKNTLKHCTECYLLRRKIHASIHFQKGLKYSTATLFLNFLLQLHSPVFPFQQLFFSHKLKFIWQYSAIFAHNFPKITWCYSLPGWTVWQSRITNLIFLYANLSIPIKFVIWLSHILTQSNTGFIIMWNSKRQINSVQRDHFPWTDFRIIRNLQIRL